MKSLTNTHAETRPAVEAHEARSLPTPLAALAFRGKTALLQARRLARDLIGGRPTRFARGESLASAPVAAESRSDLWAAGGEAERALQAGKVHNLRLAARRLDGLEVPAGAVFSFWRHVGRATHRKGYARGRELREGCLIPNVGGGLCQLSNALYDAALTAGFEVVERHAHTRVVPGSLAERGRDATVFWNYVDLRWQSPRPFRLEAFLTTDQLVVRFRAEGAREAAPALVALTRSNVPAAPTGSCASCGVEECFRYEPPPSREFGRAAFLVDEHWPEFDAHVRAERGARDLLALPLDGRRFRKANYAWGTEGFGDVREQRWLTARRALESRRLGAQGAARQRALLAQSARLAEAHARLLTYDVTHVVVSQNLLPFLWEAGHLGGRTFDVLMTGLPLARLHETLDAACRLHPESPTLADFRADARLVRAEAEALSRARRIVTPHAGVAALFPRRGLLLDWQLPQADAPRGRGKTIVFPASTLARKGAYELRWAARELGLPLVVLGAELEGEDFWRGVEVERARGGDWLEGAGVVVLPSFVENRPRRLLEAVARGVPVVASTACGLGSMTGVVSVPPGDPAALRDALQEALSRE